jgi:AbrB family looped-hinge helix DNA binding protein
MKIMVTTTLSRKYTLSIPKKMREKLQTYPGQKFQIIEIEDKLEFIPIKNIKEMRGFLKGISTEFEREIDRYE